MEGAANGAVGRLDPARTQRRGCPDARAGVCGVVAVAADDPSTGPRRHRRGWQRSLRLAGALVLLAAVAACSSLRFGYNHADTALLYTLDRYFDLDDAQKKLARERVDALLAWHRRTQLDDYARFLAQLQQGVDAPVTATDVLAAQQQMNARLLALGRHAAPDLAQLASTLSDAQLAHFRQRLAKDSAKARREFTRLDESGAGGPSEARIERSIARAKTWFGSVTAAQQRLIREANAREANSDRQWFEERERRLQELAAVLTRIRHDSAGAAALQAYFAELAAPKDAQRNAAVAAARQANAELIAALINQATPAQKAVLAEKLRGYAADLTALAAEGRPG